MTVGHFLAVSYLVLGVGIVEAHELSPSCHTQGNCVADDAMLIQLARSSSAKDQENLHTAHLVSKLEDLANKVIDGTEKITPATKEALSSIDDEMDSIIANAEQNQKDFQAAVDRTKSTIEACGAATTAAHVKEDSGINHLAAAVSTARSDHNTCRTSEAGLKQDETTKCTDFNDYVGELKMPSCSCSTAEDLGVEGFKNCVAEMTTWSSTAKTTWAAKEKLCNDATSAHVAERASCNTKQGTLESDFCAYNTALSITCGTQDSCRTTQTAEREKAHASIKVSESAFKAEYASAKHVKCILTVLNAADDAKRDMLTACTNEKHPTDQLDIVYHNIPDPAPCDLTPVTNKPCEQPWTDAEFKGKAWMTHAPLNTCVACGGAATTAAPPAISYVKVSGDSSCAAERHEDYDGTSEGCVAAAESTGYDFTVTRQDHAVPVIHDPSETYTRACTVCENMIYKHRPNLLFFDKPSGPNACNQDGQQTKFHICKKLG